MRREGRDRRPKSQELGCLRTIAIEQENLEEDKKLVNQAICSHFTWDWTNVKLVQELAQTGLVSGQIERGIRGGGVCLSHGVAQGVVDCANGGEVEDDEGNLREQERVRKMAPA